MHTSLSHLPALRSRFIETMTKTIVRSIHPEKLILFGVYGDHGDRMVLPPEEIFSSTLFPYDLLVVTRRGQKTYDYLVADIVRNRCRSSAPVSVLVHDIDYVNEQLQGGHPFFYDLWQAGVLLYDAGTVPFAGAVPRDPALICELAEKDFARWWHSANAFFRSAVANRQKGELLLSVFELHQAAECTFQTILLVHTGYKSCTHNLDKLRLVTARFSIALAAVFPRHNEKEECLFKLLLTGYVDARYNEDYSITERELEELIKRVERLLSIGAGICRNRMLWLEKLVAGKKVA